MSKKLCVVMNDDGTVMVGLEPAGEEANEGGMMDDSYLQPADNLDAAMAMGKEMLQGNPEEQAEGEQAFEDGYKQGQGSDIDALSSRGLK